MIIIIILATANIALSLLAARLFYTYKTQQIDLEMYKNLSETLTERCWIIGTKHRKIDERIIAEIGHKKFIELRDN